MDRENGWKRRIWWDCHGWFEGHKFPTYSCWDSYLHGIYGNYMELPPIEKRKTHHMKVYRLEWIGEWISLLFCRWHWHTDEYEISSKAVPWNAWKTGTDLYIGTFSKSSSNRSYYLGFSGRLAWLCCRTCKKFSITKVSAIVPGGSTGQESIYHGIKKRMNCMEIRTLSWFMMAYARLLIKKPSQTA